MISVATVEQRFKDTGDVVHVKLDGDGHHWQLTVVSDVFEGMSRVARQKWVYSILGEYIASGQLHAVGMNTWTTKEWENNHG